MSKLTMDWHNPEFIPKQGDILEFPKSRYSVLVVKPVKRRDPKAGMRFTILAERCCNLNENFLKLLMRKADRNGGQIIHSCTWNPRKKKTRTFEQLMAGSIALL